MIRRLAVSLLLALTVTAARGDPAVRVNLRDLHPSDPAAAAVLTERIHMAAEKACGPARYTADNRPSALTEADSDHRACIRYASERAMVRVQAVRPDLASAIRTSLTGQ